MTARAAKISLIGLDADDTLWHNERHYQLTEARFIALLAVTTLPRNKCKVRF